MKFVELSVFRIGTIGYLEVLVLVLESIAVVVTDVNCAWIYCALKPRILYSRTRRRTVTGQTYYNVGFLADPMYHQLLMSVIENVDLRIIREIVCV